MLRETTITIERLEQKDWSRSGAGWRKGTCELFQVGRKWCLVLDGPSENEAVGKRKLPINSAIPDSPIRINGINRFDEVEFIQKRRESMTHIDFLRSIKTLRRDLKLSQIQPINEDDLPEIQSAQEHLIGLQLKALESRRDAGEISQEQFDRMVSLAEGIISFTNKHDPETGQRNPALVERQGQ